MIRISAHLSLLATLAALWLGGSTTALAAAGGLGAPAGGSSQAFSKLTGEGQAPSEGAGEGLEAGGAHEGGEEGQKTKTTGASSSGSTPTSLLVLVFVVAGLLLGGIAFFIVRDARGMGPVTQAFAEGPTRAQALRTRRRRAKAKAARAARKRNR
jgi:hypothetical protein